MDVDSLIFLLGDANDSESESGDGELVDSGDFVSNKLSFISIF